MREISLFVDESGELGTELRRYLVCLASIERYMLLQLADFLCGLELTRIKFASHEETASDRVFFGTQGNLNRLYIKKLKRNRMDR